MPKTRPVNTMLLITANLHSHHIQYLLQQNTQLSKCYSPVRNKTRKKTIAYQLKLQFPLPTLKQLRLSKKKTPCKHRVFLETSGTKSLQKGSRSRPCKLQIFKVNGDHRSTTPQIAWRTPYLEDHPMTD